MTKNFTPDFSTNETKAVAQDMSEPNEKVLLALFLFAHLYPKKSVVLN